MIVLYQPFQNPHYPSKIANTLASLVKGRWIDGKPQTVALLHFYLRYIHLFYATNFSPSRRRDCLITISHLHQPSQTHTIPLAFRRGGACPSRCIEPLHPHNLLKAHPSSRLAQSPLPPLSKGGGLTASHKLSLCCILIATHPPFLFTKLFCRQDRGIATPLLLKPHYPLICTITLAFRRVSVCVCLYGFVFALSLSLFVGEELAPPVAHNTAIPTTIAKGQ